MAAANRFDQAAEMPILNTYVPIDFGNLYRIGATQKAAMDQAIADVSSAIQQFGEFRSPSRVDTENYYNMTIGQMSDLINQAATDPDKMKDPGFRAQFYGRLNSLNYAGLAQLRESADNLRAGLETRAKMEAEGLYNQNWDDSNIPEYDTLGTGRVFDDITPVRYMNANQLSNPYFDNLKPGTLKPVWQDGVKYQVTGNTKEDLEAVADAHMNDLIATPQGRMYMRDFLRARNGNEELARQDFRDMIVASQMDRTLRPTLTVDPAWLASLRASRSGSGKENLFVTPTRLKFIREGNIQVANRNLSQNVSQQELDQFNSQQSVLEQQAAQAYQRYLQNPTDDNLILVRQAQNRVYMNQGQFILDNNRKTMDKQFQSVFNQSIYDELPEQINHKDYNRAVNSALSSVENDIALASNDKLITNLGALPVQITDEGNAVKQAFQFNTSYGFMLPERIMQLIADPSGQQMPTRNIDRGTWFLNTKPLGFEQALTSGSFSMVQFIPDNKIIQVAPDVHAVKGKVRISRDEIEDVLGTGSWFSRTTDPGALGIVGSQRTDDLLEGAYNMRKVKEKSGDDDFTYYELDVYRLLPNETENPEWWTSTETSWNNTNNYGGIGSATMANSAFQASAMQNLGY